MMMVNVEVEKISWIDLMRSDDVYLLNDAVNHWGLYMGLWVQDVRHFISRDLHLRRYTKLSYSAFL